MRHSTLLCFARVALAVPAFALLGALPQLASAATFCVHSPPGCAGTNAATLQDALDDADANGANRDQIMIGVGLFDDGPAVDVAGNPVDLIGVALNQTAIRSTQATVGLVILDIQEPTSEVRDLRVHYGGTAPTATGLVLAGDAKDVLVTNQGFGGQYDGVRLINDAASFVNSSVSLVYPQNLQNRAVFVPSGASPLIAGSLLEGTVGVLDSGEATILRTRIRGTQGVVASAGAGTVVRDTQIRVPGPFKSNFEKAALTAGGNGTVDLEADRVTAYGDGTGFGAWLIPNGGAGNNAGISLEGSVLDGFATDVYLTESAGANAALTSKYSAYDSTKLAIGAGTSHVQGTGKLDLAGLDPRFADPGAGDLSLLHDSPLIDGGDPSYQPFLGGLDVMRRTRVRDGDGDGSQVVDIGAHEYQRSAPVASASAPASGKVGQTLTFDGSSSTDADDEVLAYSWSFDDGSEAIGAVVEKSFATAGPHAATLTVTDPAGVSDADIATVTIEALAGPGPGPGPGQGTQALELSGLKLVPGRFSVGGAARGAKAAKAGRTRHGTRIGFTLSQVARVTFTVHRARSKRRWVKVGSFARDGRSGANSLRWGGRIGKRALVAGRYRLTAQARTGNGSSSLPRRTKFTIVLG